MGKLTDIKVRKAKAKEDTHISDGDGLALRVYPKRGITVKTWIFRYRQPGTGKQTKLPLGDYPALTLADARQAARAARQQLAEGIDPKRAHAAKRQENAEAATMQTAFESWIDQLRVGGTVSEKWTDRHSDRWRLHLKSRLGEMLARDVTRGHLAGALDAMTRKGIKEETRKALTTLNLMLDYAVNRQLIEQNPARLLKPKDFAASAARPRDRALNLGELRQVWAALDKALDSGSRLSPVTVAALKVLILTGARREEVARMEWAELDLDAGVWVLPEVRTKNRRGHTVYLSPLAVEILRGLEPLSGTGPYVFESSRRNLDAPEQARSMHPDTLSRTIYRLRGDEDKAKGKGKKAVAQADREPAPLANLEHFTVHDLRRSAATAWGEYLKTPPHIIERMLNHLPEDKLVATYQRAVYADEQRKAWEAWGALVERQVAREPGNVISMSVSSAKRA
ncbi:tyrosine-type recombinase/integrase [Marinobacter psychrophilus]|jgi:integrase|uniref:tyrosine-type recombinase/integrase n=1 Tax=Marinobacter psychrophilus TaxID=330734 RepID=UPI001B6E95F1|nr:site-specific integrase [Marinobacter psychrophilus]MBQ0761411.1 integrase arm-type DNA-binding domain-containing protein [Marinobacter psychrophilus]MBQ0843419.1 integrase arm-type DNA-binding domain-containing protein [Marinobacter psychrophilus]